MLLPMVGFLFILFVGGIFLGLVFFLIRPLKPIAPYVFFCPILASLGSLIASWGLALIGEMIHSNTIAGAGFFLGYIFGAIIGAYLGLRISSKIGKRDMA